MEGTLKGALDLTAGPRYGLFEKTYNVSPWLRLLPPSIPSSNCISSSITTSISSPLSFILLIDGVVVTVMSITGTLIPFLLTLVRVNLALF